MSKHTNIAPKVSIIMTVYNAEKHIKESIESALAQTLRDIEIVCIDGHSTDKTCQIIETYMRSAPCIKLFVQQKPGIGAAKNYGIDKSSGEFITFLDADDFYVDNSALKKMYDACINQNVLVCGAFRSTLYLDGTVANEPLHRNDCKKNSNGILLKYIDRQYDYHFHSYLYNRQMVMNSNARFAEVSAYDDTHFFIRAMLAADSFYIAPVELYRYRCGPAYSWGMQKANDAIVALTDQLKVTSDNKLVCLHWLTVQRINYEYGGIFEKNIRAGDYTLLKLLIEANSEVNSDYVEYIQNNLPSENWYIEPMIHRKSADMPLRMGTNEYAPHYILEPLWRLMFLGNVSVNTMLDETNDLKEQLNMIQHSRSYKVGKFITFFPRKLRGGLLCVKENGMFYTLIRIKEKILSIVKGKML